MEPKIIFEMGSAKICNMFINVNEPIISQEAKKNVITALDTGWISSLGPFVFEFEEQFARKFGVKHAVTVSSGTAALHTALLAMGIGKGDEVIVSAFTMAASWMSIIYTGAIPVFVDCEQETYNIDVDAIENKITDKTKAIMAIHLYGHSCEMDAIVALGKKYKLYVIEDAAEVHGGEYKGKKCGTMGHVGCFSFYANKIITTGEGGMIVTNDDTIAKRARKLKDLYPSDKKRFIHDEIGYNYRMTNLQAAVGLGELQNIEKYIKIKQEMAEIYDKGLGFVPGLKTPTTKPYVKNVYWMYGILIDEKKFGMSRDELREKLKKAGIDTRDFFYPPEDQPFLQQYIKSEKFPHAKYISDHGLYLPSGLAITPKQQKYVIQSVQKLQKDNSSL